MYTKCRSQNQNRVKEKLGTLTVTEEYYLEDWRLSSITDLSQPKKLFMVVVPTS